MNYNNWKKEQDLDNSKYLRKTTNNIITPQSNYTMTSRHSMTSSDDNHDKVVSITDERFDSGIASLTASEEENNRYIDEMCGSDNQTDRQESTGQLPDIIEGEVFLLLSMCVCVYVCPHFPFIFTYLAIHGK